MDSTTGNSLVAKDQSNKDSMADTGVVVAADFDSRISTKGRAEAGPKDYNWDSTTDMYEADAKDYSSDSTKGRLSEAPKGCTMVSKAGIQQAPALHFVDTKVSTKDKDATIKPRQFVAVVEQAHID